MFLDYLSSITLAISGGTLLINLAWFRQPSGVLPDEPPLLSILVPARNEERGIGRCVRSLLGQDYPNFELIVLDDRSEDGTGEILAEIVQDYPKKRFTICHGKPLSKAGLPSQSWGGLRGGSKWTGKNWACHQLAGLASPESRYLLFTDADTLHAPHALRDAMAEALRDEVALLSLMPTQEVKTWAEWLVVPLLALQIIGYLPLPALEWLSAPTFAAANGQFMLFGRDVYNQMGGHAAVSHILAEDVSLAALTKASGGKVRLANGAGLVSCRMYHNASEVIASFRRSFSSGFRVNAPVATLIVLANFVVYLLPFLRSPRHRLARLLSILIIALRLMLAWKTETPLRSAIAHPLGILLMLWAQLLAFYDFVRGKQASWKGRQY